MIHSVKGLQQHSFKAFACDFKSLDGGSGIFEAIVAAFGNVDRGGDRIVMGAFTDTLKAWAEKGRSIPVIFAHEWENLDAHIGSVLEAAEVPEGLYVRGQLAMDEPFAARVFKKMQAGLLAEFSFAYDVVEHVWNDKDGIRELKAVDLFEVGPCLVGMNPETRLIAVKEGRRNSATDSERLQSIHDLCLELGAKCVQPDAAGGDANPPAKSEEPERAKDEEPRGRSTYATRVAIELMELSV